MSSKFPEQSKTIQTDIVLPGDTNSLNNLFGGELLARMDKVASIAAIKHSEQIVVTASINNVAFGEPVPNGSILTIEAKVSRAFNSSMEVFIFWPRVNRFLGFELSSWNICPQVWLPGIIFIQPDWSVEGESAIQAVTTSGGVSPQ